MRKRKVLNRYSNCYEGECLFCHDVTCMVEQGYQKEEFEQFTPDDYKNHITDLARLIVNEGANGLIKHFGTLLNFNDDKLINWAIKNCSDDAALAEFAKHMPSQWKNSPYAEGIDFLLSKIKDKHILGELIVWADSARGEEKLLQCALERLCRLEETEEGRKAAVKYIPYHKGLLEELIAEVALEEDEDSYDYEYEYDEYEDDKEEEPEMTQEELFESAKNYMDIDRAEKAVYRLTDASLLAELAKGAW